VEREVPASWVGERSPRLGEGPARIVGVRRYGNAMLAAPEVLMQEGDVVYLAVANADIAKLDQFLAKGPVTE
jgi:Trk K+ transport system NAD-binding subunit